MTRHGLHLTRAATTVLRPAAHLVPDVANTGPVVSLYHHANAREQRAAPQYRSSVIRQTCGSLGQTIQSGSQESKSP